jgi:hypothetical protein
VGGAVLAALLTGPVSPNAPASVELWSVVRPQPTSLSAVLDTVPRDAPVAAFNQALAHLMHRRPAYLFPLPFRAPRDTYPGGLAPPPSSRAAARIRVAVVLARDEGTLRELGFRQITRGRGGIVVGRR